jgi:hypothetical protein
VNFHDLLGPVPPEAKLQDADFFTWGAGMVRARDGGCHLFYSRWPRELGFEAWVTHSEIAHALSNEPTGPFEYVDVALPKRGAEYWDGLCTHNPTIHEFDGKFYLYYMGNTGDGRLMKGLNWTHRNNQRIGVAVAEDLNGTWERSERPLIDVSTDEDAPDALLVSNPTVCCRPDQTYVLIYKCVGTQNPMPFGGPVAHMVATSTSPTGPFVKRADPIFTREDSEFPAEDPFAWSQDGRFWAIVKDMHGAFTKSSHSLALFQSSDALQWRTVEHPLVTIPTVEWQVGGIQELERLERPQLWLDDGVPAVLFCAAKNGDETFNVHIPLKRTGAE